ncbi:hypothetical protein ACQEU8_19610 [Streptomyces sp. CA-250714]|uniref:hypothetical protein n=1 Tax=Streptomyces sp. CA-250714 TaxID=3240060 RepID=UPI003D94665D
MRYIKGGREFCDLKTDPYEMSSKHDDPAYVVARMALEEGAEQAPGVRAAHAARASGS